MRKTTQILTLLLLTVLIVSTLCVPAFALDESEVEAAVSASSKETVTGNVLIWFLCAVAFLKVSQKIDSFMATLGVNVGRTGGSMLAEAMVAMRAVTMVVGGGHGGAGRAASAGGGTAGKSGASGMTGFFKGGLVGMAGRHITNSAVKTATTQTSAVHTAQNQVSKTAAAASATVQTASDAHINSEVHTGGSTIHTESSTHVGAPPQDDAIIMGGGPSPQTIPMESAPLTASDTHINSEVHTGGSTVHTENSALSGIPPQEGVILTGSGPSAQTVPIESPPPAGPAPSGVPPQEGVILTGSEPPPSVPPADPTLQTVGVPPEGTPPPEGAILTGGENTVHAPQTENVFSGGVNETVHKENTAVTGGEQRTEVHTERTSQTTHTASSSERIQTNRFHSGTGARPTLGGMVFSRSLAAGGSFANDVIGTVARGEVSGSITGDMAAQSLSSYMGYAPTGIGSREAPIYSDVEIGRGRITGVETAAGTSEGLSFAMYHVDQYNAPAGEYTKVVSADGTQWYKQYAQDAVERKPYMAPDDTVAYHERIIKKLPDPPKHKDRV